VRPATRLLTDREMEVEVARDRGRDRDSAADPDGGVPCARGWAAGSRRACRPPDLAHGGADSAGTATPFRGVRVLPADSRGRTAPRWAVFRGWGGQVERDRSGGRHRPFERRRDPGRDWSPGWAKRFLVHR